MKKGLMSLSHRKKGRGNTKGRRNPRAPPKSTETVIAAQMRLAASVDHLGSGTQGS